MTLTPAVIAEMRRLEGEATEAPWNPRREEYEGGHDQMIAAMSETLRRGHHVLYFVEHNRDVYPAVTGNGPTSKVNAAFIVALRNHAPALLDAAESVAKIGDLLAENGCNCDCEHGFEEHDDCERCLACRISLALTGGK